MSNDIKGLGNSYTADYWEYDSRIGRRWNLDPKPFTSLSPYAVLANSPILFHDPRGDTAVVGAAGLYGLELDNKENSLEFYENKQYNVVGTNTPIPVEAGQLRAFTNFLGRFSATWREQDGIVSFVGYKNEAGDSFDDALLSYRRKQAVLNMNMGRDILNWISASYEKSQTDPVGYVNDLMIMHFSLYTPGTGGVVGTGRNVSTITQSSMSALGTLNIAARQNLAKFAGLDDLMQNFIGRDLNSMTPDLLKDGWTVVNGDWKSKTVFELRIDKQRFYAIWEPANLDHSANNLPTSYWKLTKGKIRAYGENVRRVGISDNFTNTKK